MRTLSPVEKNLLLYLETVCVDNAGKIEPCRMNEADWHIFETWREAGFIQGGRIAFHDIDTSNARVVGGGMPAIGVRTHWVVLSDEAWALAHLARRKRAERMLDRATYRRTGT